MKYTTTIRIDGDIWNLAKANGINLSLAVDDLLKGYILQFQTPEMMALREDIDNTRVKLNDLECKYSTLNNERIKALTYSKQLKNNLNFDRWLASYKELKRINDLMAIDRLIREINTKTSIPIEIIHQVIDPKT